MRLTVEEKLIDVMFLVMLVIALVMMCVDARAEPQIVFLNKCVDESNWDCLNVTQAAKRKEIREQVNRACRGKDCKIIHSIDPKMKGKYDPSKSWFDQNLEYTFGAWRKGHYIYFAAMPGCKNAERVLRRLLK